MISSWETYSGCTFSETMLCNAHEISRKSSFLISGSGRSMNILFASSKFSLIRRTLKADNSWSFAYIVKQKRHEKARRIQRTASDLILQNLPCNDFATCLIPADVNQVKGERFFAIKATANEGCLFNSSSILLHGNESLALLLHLLVAGELYFNAQFYCDHDPSNGMKQRQKWRCESAKLKL